MKIYIVKKNIIFLLILIVLCSYLLTLGGSTSFASVYFGENLKLYPIYKVDTQEKNVAITFDAAWGADKTIQIMDVCDEFGIKATFFL